MATASVTTAVQHGLSKSRLPNANRKEKLKTRQLNQHHYSPVEIYLEGLAPSGRAAMEVLLNQSVILLQEKSTAKSYDWSQLTFEKVHFVKSTFIDVGYAVNTVNQTLSALKGVAKAAFNLGLLSGDDFLRINHIKSLRGSVVRTGRRITGEEVSQLFSQCTDCVSSARDARNQAIVSIGIGAGLRSFEICALNLCDIHIGTGVLTVKAGKGKKHRQIFLAREVIAAIAVWLKHRGTLAGPLFCRIGKNGSISVQRLTPNGLAHAIDTLRQSSNIPAFTPHDMRRTFITRLLENNVDINTVRQLAGHTSISTTTRYDMRDVLWQQQASQSLSL